MRGLASAQVSPGSRTCIVVGNVDGVEDLDLGAYPNVLWFGRDGGALPDRFRVDPRRLAVEPVGHADPARTTAVLDRFIRLDALRPPSIFVTEEILGEHADRFLPVIETIMTQCEIHLHARGFRQQQGFTSQRHVLANLPAYVRHRLPRAWAGALDGVPAFVCGAGPSLDASAAKLAACAGRGVVFAADSALRALDRRGIAVDFAVTVDPRKTPEHCLPPGTRAPGRMIAASAGVPGWRQAVPPERLFFLSGRQRTEDLLERSGFSRTAVTAGENCGATAFELAVHLGCRPICLFGLDHAVDGKDPARWHSQDHTQVPLVPGSPAPERSHPTVPGNYQDEIATPFFREWSFLDGRCAALPAGLVRNVTDRGARLRNTALVHPDAFAAEPDWPGKSPRLARLPAAAPVAGGDWEKLRATVVRDAQRAGTFAAQALRELRHGRAPHAVQALTALFREDRFGLLFGNYSLKAMPHLVQPAEVSPQVWQELASECRELCAVAQNLR
jgi:hypothetical protein